MPKVQWPTRDARPFLDARSLFHYENAARAVRCVSRGCNAWRAVARQLQASLEAERFETIAVSREAARFLSRPGASRDSAAVRVDDGVRRRRGLPSSGLHGPLWVSTSLSAGAGRGLVAVPLGACACAPASAKVVIPPPSPLAPPCGQWLRL